MNRHYTLYIIIFTVVLLSIHLKAQTKVIKPASQNQSGQEIDDVREQSDDIQIANNSRNFPQKPKATNYEYTVSLGNFILGSGGYSFSGKGAIGYRPIDKIAIGIDGKFYYDFLNNSAGFRDNTLTSFGIGPYAKVALFSSIYAIGMLQFNTYELGNFNDDGTHRRNTVSPYIGGGYETNNGASKTGIQLLFLLDDSLRNDISSSRSNIFDAFEYWITFSKAF